MPFLRYAGDFRFAAAFSHFVYFSMSFCFRWRAPDAIDAIFRRAAADFRLRRSIRHARHALSSGLLFSPPRLRQIALRHSPLLFSDDYFRHYAITDYFH